MPKNRDAELVETLVWDEAGFSFRESGIYITDFGMERKVADWDETDQPAGRYYA